MTSLSALIGALIAATVFGGAEQECQVELIVLGVGQDAGSPQIGNSSDPAWVKPDLKRSAASIALVDHRSGKRFLFEATPDLREQLQSLDQVTLPGPGPLGLSGVFLTHAHIGHYAGLIFVGHESAGTASLPVYAMPRMADFLSQNGPWSQLVNYQNIEIRKLSERDAVSIGETLSVMPYLVPHRDEYSETVGYVIDSQGLDVLFVPDIDDWDRWELEYKIQIEDMVDRVDVAYVDATFFDDNELPGRDMSQIPHPRVVETMARFAEYPEATREKIRFIHFNHTNPLRFPDSTASSEVREAGFGIATEGERICLMGNQDDD